MHPVANWANTKLFKTLKNGWKPFIWYSSESTQRELSSYYQEGLDVFKNPCIRVLWTTVASALEGLNSFNANTGELGYDGPLYDGFLHMTDDMLGPSPMQIKYSSYVYDGFCIWRTNLTGPIESVISKLTCITQVKIDGPERAR